VRYICAIDAGGWGFYDPLGRPTDLRLTLMSYTARSLILLILTAAVSLPANGAGADLDEATVLRAIEHARRHLLSTQEPDGTWGDGGVGQRARLTLGRTALCTYALLQAGESPNNAAVRRAADALAAAKMTGTYNVSLRCMVAAKLASWERTGKFRRRMNQDAAFLQKSNLPNGQWTYTRVERPDPDVPNAAVPRGDNSNSQFAVLALREAHYAGARVPRQFWSKLEAYWTASQRSDGGWNYVNDATPSYGSMTGAGLATSFILLDVLHTGQCCSHTTYAPAERGLDWMRHRFRAERNPGKLNWWHYYMYSVERVGETSGIRYFGRRDWFAEGASTLLERSRFGQGGSSEFGPVETAFALIFLARGAAPVLMNKLDYGTGSNANPRDVAHVTWYLSNHKFERPLNWQVVQLEAPVEAWQDSPVLFMSVSEPPSFDEAAVAKIRRHLDRGATLWVDVTCKSDNKVVGVTREFVTSLYPDRPLRKLPADHPVYTALFQLDDSIALEGVGNGCREMVFLSGPDAKVSCTWHRFLHRSKTETFELAGNVFLYATDKQFHGKLHKRTTLARTAAPPKRQLRVARLDHDRTPNPCPTALNMLSGVMSAQSGVGLEVLDKVRGDDPRLATCRAAWLTGIGVLTLTPAEREGLERFIAQGGLLVVSPALGDADFNASALRLIQDLTGETPVAVPPDDPMITGTYAGDAGFDISEVRYTRRLRVERRTDRASELSGVRRNGRWSVVHTPFDLVNGMALHTPFNGRGYELDHASRVAANVLLSAMAPSTTGAAEDTTRP